MHEQGVAHRDIKPENLLLSHKNELKITDFGLSTVAQKNPLGMNRKIAKTMCGSAFYAAPEIWSLDITGPYNPFDADIWSIGVVLYAMLVGKPPIRVARAVCPKFRALNSNRFQFPKHLSDEVVSLIKSCLIIDPDARPTAKQLLKHKWLQDERANHVPQKALDVLLRTVIGDRTKWATHEELLHEGWLGKSAGGAAADTGSGENGIGTNALNRTTSASMVDNGNINVPDCIKILKDASVQRMKEKAREDKEGETKELNRGDAVTQEKLIDGETKSDNYTSFERPVKRAKITTSNDVSDLTKKQSAVRSEAEYEPARQIAGLGWTGMMCARENARKRVQESLKSLGLVIVDVDDDDKKGRSEIVAVASTGLTRAMASGTNVAVTKAMIKDAYAEVGALMSAGVGLPDAEKVQQQRLLAQQQHLNMLLNHRNANINVPHREELKNVPIHKDECRLVAKVTIYEELNKSEGENDVKHTIHFTRGAGDVFAYHGLYKMIRSKLKDLNQGCF